MVCRPEFFGCNGGSGAIGPSALFLTATTEVLKMFETGIEAQSAHGDTKKAPGAADGQQ